MSDIAPPAAAIWPWSPLRNETFRYVWMATVVSNIAAWMQDVGAGWLMTTLAPDPFMVALVQTATTLPAVLLVLPAGALAHIVDRRRFLIGVQLWMVLVSGTLAVLTLAGLTTSWTLLGFTFALGLGTALMMPAWAALRAFPPRSRLRQCGLSSESLSPDASPSVS